MCRARTSGIDPNALIVVDQEGTRVDAATPLGVPIVARHKRFAEGPIEHLTVIAVGELPSTYG